MNRNNRAQTLPDFVAAMVVFLLVVSFILLLVPQMTAPYEDQADPLVAERISSDLANGLLASNDSTGIDAACTIDFFTDANVPECDLEPLGRDSLGPSEYYRVRVTLTEATGDPLCADNGSIGVCSPGDVTLETGPAVPAGTSVSTTRRLLHLEGTPAVLQVEVWTP